MKKLVTLLLISLTLLSNAQTGLLAGTGYAPDFTVTDINGTSHNLYNYLDSGKVVVLELMSVTCGHCQSHAAGTENSYQTNGPSGTNVARFLGLEVNTATDSAAVANFASTYGVTFPIANNVSPTAINYQLYYTPGYYIIYPDRSYTTICALYCVTAQNYSTIEGLLNTAIASWVPPVYGCTDSLAVNYNPLATVNNDSCDFTSYTIKTLGMSFSPDTIICDVGDTINFILGGYHNAVEVSDSTWLANGNTSNGGFSFGYGATGMFIPDDCHTFYYVCQSHTSSGMKGVIIAHHPPVSGCTDSLALNYDSLATVDDGSCIYSTLASDLFISEYAEGSGTNKYIEIFNGTGQDVDLSNYQLWKVTNGGTWPEYTFNLSSILSHNHVYIVYSSSSSVDPIIAAAGDVTWSQVTWTGDDAVGLAKSVPGLGSSFTLIDAIGEDGSDPGTGWNVAGVTNATKDHTLVRKCSVTGGNTNWSLSSGTNAQDSEWEVFSQNYWTDIDQHTFPCQSATVYGCTDSTALNYDPLATIDDGSCVLVVYGCTDSTAFNYDATANSDDGSCCFQSGCTDPNAYNYDPSACYNDGSCITPIFGCMSTSAMNFDSTATIDDNSCIYLADKVDLFFSEYGEGNSNNKYLEIYNSTSNSVDLSSYALTRVSNAPTTVGVYEYWVDFDSAAVISANDVYIVAHSSADSSILAQSDMTYSSLSNGDDGFALVYGGKPSSPVLPGNEYIILDFLGDFNGDPGSGWDVAGVSQATKDHVLIRKCDVNIGNTNWTNSAGTDSLNSEWTVLANEDWSDIGQHTNICQSSPVYGCTDPTACNYDTLADTDDGSCILPDGCIDPIATNYDPAATCDDGSCVYCVWGCTGPTSCNYDPLATCDDGSCYGAIGCMDSLATNYDPFACLDDGSCTYPTTCSNPLPTGIYIDEIIQVQAKIHWDNMSNATCMALKYHVQFRELGTSSWSWRIAQDAGLCNQSLVTTEKVMYGLTASTTYEYRMRALYCNTSGNSGWSSIATFTTADECPNVTNLTATPGPQAEKVVFSWDTVGSYSMVRIKLRVDSISNPQGSDWQMAGGFGVNYPALSVNKWGLVAGETYRGQARTWCNPAAGLYRSPNWTALIWWTQPTSIRVENTKMGERELIRITDLLGREVNPEKVIDRTTLFYIYNDGTVEKKIKLD